LLENPVSADNWFITQIPDDPTTVNYWIKDSLIWNMDTLHVAVTYLRTDSLYQLQLNTDTIPLSTRRQPTTPQRRTRSDEPPPIDFLTMTIAPSGSINLYDTLSITFPEPVLEMNKEFFQLELKQDTLWNPVDFDFRQDSVNSLRYYVERNWDYEESYRLIVDSALIFSLYGKWNNTLQSTFQFKSKDEYGHFFLEIEGVSEPAFVELLNASDVPVRKAKVQDGGALFLNLKPDKYYARLIVDSNENGIWDTGNYAEKLQPEEVYYDGKVYEIRANWEIEETWDVLSVPLIKQKPMDITKNKPKDVDRPRRDYRQEGQSQSQGGMALPGGLGRNIGF